LRFSEAIGGILAVLAAGAVASPAFLFDPQPRWAEDPDTDVVCEAVRAECAGLLKDGSIETEFGYIQLFDAAGRLAGIRMAKSTGCKPLDEHLLLSERHFVDVFHHDGQSDLDGMKLELGPGVDRDKVRIAKPGSTQVSFGCS